MKRKTLTRFILIVSMESNLAVELGAIIKTELHAVDEQEKSAKKEF